MTHYFACFFEESSCCPHSCGSQCCATLSDVRLCRCLAVRGGRLQRQLCLPGGAGAPRSQPLQPAELLQAVQPGQAEGGVALQGRTQQEEEAQEQTQVLPTYVPCRRSEQTPLSLLHQHVFITAERIGCIDSFIYFNICCLRRS